ncbi:hypothetical protein [Actinomadura fibrosa]|uniref:DUF1257 domain-containing protein n=1 Tax=Actinomadura fibrosa TaxID=111802 RepID=A0ABW2XP84_9ACTN|nr:hypothetical protein [Actinomadura fibrosa]
MADNIRLQVTGPPDQARGLLEQTLQADGYRFTWENAGQGIVEKGSRKKAMLLGAFAIHYKYGVMLYPQQDGTVVIDLGLGNTGMSGGAIGVVKVRKNLDTVRQQLVTAYQNAGALVSA